MTWKTIVFAGTANSPRETLQYASLSGKAYFENESRQFPSVGVYSIASTRPGIYRGRGWNRALSIGNKLSANRNLV